jgi:hypothetical protein
VVAGAVAAVLAVAVAVVDRVDLANAKSMAGAC